MQQLRLNVEGVVQGRVRQTQVPFTVSLFNWRVGRMAGLGGRLRQQHRSRRRPLRSAAGEVRLRYTLDASLSSTIREVRLNRLDVTAVGAIR